MVASCMEPGDAIPCCIVDDCTDWHFAVLFPPVDGADKLCDRVSDAVLDACLTVDPDAKVACGELDLNGHVMAARLDL